jgi:hypothetical protein
MQPASDRQRLQQRIAGFEIAIEKGAASIVMPIIRTET